MNTERPQPGPDYAHLMQEALQRVVDILNEAEKVGEIYTFSIVRPEGGAFALSSLTVTRNAMR